MAGNARLPAAKSNQSNITLFLLHHMVATVNNLMVSDKCQCKFSDIYNLYIFGIEDHCCGVGLHLSLNNVVLTGDR